MKGRSNLDLFTKSKDSKRAKSGLIATLCKTFAKLSDKRKRFIAQKLKFSIKDFFIKYGQIYRQLRICSHLLNKSLKEDFIFCTVFTLY